MTFEPYLLQDSYHNDLFQTMTSDYQSLYESFCQIQSTYNDLKFHRYREKMNNGCFDKTRASYVCIACHKEKERKKFEVTTKNYSKKTQTWKKSTSLRVPYCNLCYLYMSINREK